jgi:peptide/nickel transport system substrate-binding protein
VLVLAACNAPVSPGQPTPSPSANTIALGGVVRVAQSSDIQSLDPWTASDDQTITALRQIYEGLVDLEPGGVRIVPKLAESWTTAGDGRTWTFRLRQGVTFHDGSALDATSVVRNFDRARSFARFDLGTLISTVTASDRATVVITLTTPSASFLATLAAGSFAIVNPACFAQGPSWSTAASHCAQGTGPFRYEAGAWKPGESITLQRYASYWGRDADARALPYVDTLVFSTIRDDAVRVAELRAANVAVALDLGPASLAAVRSDPNLAIRRRPAYDVSYLGIGTGVKPFDIPDVRRAIALSIDRGAIVQTVYGGEARAASQLVPPGFVGYDDTLVEFSKYDANAAKKALSDAGYGAGLSADLWYVPAARSALPDPKRIAETIAADLGKIGITVKLQTTTDASALATMARAGTLALWIDDRTADRADPEDFFAGVTNDPVASELLRRARTELDPSKRAELYKQVSKMWTTDIPRVPLFHAAPPIAVTRKLPGLIPQPIVGESFAGVWIGR